MTTPTCASCGAPLPTRLVSSPIDGERFLLREAVDIDAWRAHLLDAHPVRPKLRATSFGDRLATAELSRRSA